MMIRRLAAAACSVWPYALVLALATAARLAALDRIDYRYDQAVAIRFALDIAGGRLLALAPNSGSLATHPPLTLYAMAIPALIARDALWVAGFRAALDVCGVGLVMAALAGVAGRPAALSAGLLYAMGPWAVAFARNVWVVSLTAASALMLVGAVALVARQKAWGWPVATLGAALAAGGHLSGLYTVPGLLIIAMLGRKALRPRPFLAGLTPLAVFAAGYLAADGQTGFHNLRSVLASTGGGVVSAAAPTFALWQVSAFRLAEVVGLRTPVAPEGSPLEWINVAPMLLLVGGIAVSVARCIGDRQSAPGRAGLALASFWLADVALQARTTSAPQPHYVLVVLPAAFGLAGLAAGWLWEKIRWGRTALAAILVGVVVFDGMAVAGMAIAASGPGPYPGYRPLWLARQATEAARALDARCGGAGEILVAAPAEDPWVDEGAAVFSTLLEDRRPRIFSFREAAIVPVGCATWAIAPGDAPALRAFGAPPGPAAFGVPALAAGGAVLGTWEHGAALEGVVAEPGGVAVTVRVAGPRAASGDAHWTARVWRDGQEVAASDIGGVAPGIWRDGDRLRLWFAFDPSALAPPPNSFRIGSYRYPDVSGIGVRLPDGTWAEAVTVPAPR